MAEKELAPLLLSFGGGINRRRRPFDIDPQECFDGQNFDLDHQFAAMHRRNAFQLMGTAPNGQAIRGYAQLQKRDGTITTLIQAGGTVYSWDGATGFTMVGVCSALSRLRGLRSQNFPLEDMVIITDLEKLTIVKQWDGMAFTDFVHNLSQPFYAKYCRVQGERAYFANVQSGTDTPHVLLGSKISDPHTLTVANRPSSSLGDNDPFFIPAPDLKPINGLEVGFGQFFLSTVKGQIHVLSGSSAKDFSLDSFYAGSAVSGDEAMVNIGNDVVFGLPGRIETLSGTLNFGDVETNDTSLPIAPLIEDVTEWILAYGRLLQKVYCFPSNSDMCWVLHKSLMGEKFSPWSKWVTSHPATFMPSCIMQIDDPGSELAKVFMGDLNGNVYDLEGRSGQDGGTTDIDCFRRSILFRLPANRVFDVEGSITYLKAFAATLELTFEYGGITISDQPITIQIPDAVGAAVYNGNAYFNGTFYYNAGFTGRLTRRDFSAAGIDNFIQINTRVAGAADIEIHEIELRLRAAEG